MIKNKKLQWTLFILMAIAQLAVPAWMIYNKEKTKTEGKLYKFELGAIDPNDPFRGKYIIINPMENSHFINLSHQKQQSTMFATFVEDSLGLAKIDSLYNQPPLHKDYLNVNVAGGRQSGDSLRVSVNYPFDRYYMNEYKAKRAETISRAANRDTSRLCYAEVFIYDGKATLNAVKIDDVAIEDLIGN